MKEFLLGVLLGVLLGLFSMLTAKELVDCRPAPAGSIEVTHDSMD